LPRLSSSWWLAMTKLIKAQNICWIFCTFIFHSILKSIFVSIFQIGICGLFESIRN
jgi:hypothetical protein